MKFVNCSQADALVAGQVYRITFTQTTAQNIGSFLFAGSVFDGGFGQELLAVYQRISDQGKSPYAYPVSQPPVGDNAVVIDVKIRSQEFHAGTVGDLASSLGDLSQFVDVDTVQKPTPAELGTAGRAAAIDTAQQQGQQAADTSGFFAGLENFLGSLKTIVIVVAVGAGLVAVAYLARPLLAGAKHVKPS